MPKLTTARTFSRTVQGQTFRLTLPAGTGYQYSRTATSHVATYVGPTGVTWTSEQPIAQQVAAVVANAPTTTTSNQTSLDSTARSAKAAIEVLSDHQTKCLDQEERRVRRADRAVRMLTGKVFSVNYYIPDHFGSRLANPSPVFERHGFRLDGSNWVFPEEGINHPAVQEVFAEFVKVREESAAKGETGRKPYHWAIEWTAQQLAAVKASAMEQLAEELREAHVSLITRIDAAATRLTEARAALEAATDATERDHARLDDQHNGAMRSAVRDACERFEMCLKGAELFDDTGDLDVLFASTKDALRTAALSVNAMLMAKGRKTVDVPASIA